MNEHDSVRALLALAAAGALNDSEHLRVIRHLETCDACRREFETWRGYAQAMVQLPQPAVPAWLAERTQARILQARDAASQRRWETARMIALSLFAWSVSLATWPMLRLLTTGVFETTGALSPFSLWMLGSTALAWATASAAAVMLRRRALETRRFL